MPNWASAEEQFIPNYPPPDHNLGQILNSDPASSYFPLKFADLLKLKYFLHPWQPVILYYTITTIKANRDNSSYRINSLDLFCSVVLLLSCLSCYCYHYCPHKSAFQLKIAAQFSPPFPSFKDDNAHWCTLVRIAHGCTFMHISKYEHQLTLLVLVLHIIACGVPIPNPPYLWLNPPYLWFNPKSPLNLLFMVQKATT